MGVTSGAEVTINVILVAAVLYLPVSVGVKVTLYGVTPLSSKAGVMLGSVQAKLPGTEAEPPLRVLAASVCPTVIAEAVGGVEMLVVALTAVTFSVTWVAALKLSFPAWSYCTTQVPVPVSIVKVAPETEHTLGLPLL